MLAWGIEVPLPNGDTKGFDVDVPPAPIWDEEPIVDRDGPLDRRDEDLHYC